MGPKHRRHATVQNRSLWKEFNALNILRRWLLVKMEDSR